MQILKTVKSYLLMTIGLFIFVFSWTAFLIPHEIAGGGVSGLASVINYATGFDVSYSYLIINAVLLGIGFLVLGKAFGFKTIYCIAVAALMFEFLPLIPWVSDIEDKLIREAMKKFYWIREMDGLKKKPSTSELLDWIKALSLGGIKIDKVNSEIPFLGTLLKNEQDTDRFVRMSTNQGGFGFKRRY